ncbi:S9 family peptidase [Ktedonosporobacter rubrisoli]|uniref:S9 family peptidase n=1 Tax=Ktedonosporobacter rubrisoli TaxID=2509675 RepID=A0A4P6JQQ0_KTERU|nr:S9 family peptidase [Ktedonosporobacter rubrisoli]QBD77758.1 S9 family peptidase [Ktedonosporobacter rubrisoli]
MSERASSLSSVSSPRVPVTPDNLFSVLTPTDPVISPDGQHVAYVVWAYAGADSVKSGHIWLLNCDEADAKPYPCASGKYSEQEPRWSPDGQKLAFLAVEQSENGQAGKPQLYVRPLEREQARRICEMPNGVSDPAWSPDGSQIAFISLDGPEPAKDPIVLAPARPRRLWSTHTDGGLPVPITPEGVTIWEYAWSPDGRYIALYYSTGSDDTDWYRGQIGIVPASGGAVRQLTQLTRQASGLAWSPDSQQLAYISGEWSDPCQGGGDIYVIAINGGEARNVTPGLDCSPGWCAWFPDDQRLLFAGWYGVTSQVGIVDLGNNAITLLEEDFVIVPYTRLMASTPDLRRFLVIHSSSQEPAEVWLGELEQVSEAHVKWRCLTHLNALAEESFALSQSRRIRYPSVDGWLIDAIFTPPLHTRPGELPPLFVEVHGGPSGARQDCCNLYVQMLASAGYAVLQPNMRGSWGHGVAFADAVLGDMGGKDYQDILYGADYVIAQGWVDPERTSIGGWSNGGFLSGWTITHTDRFKAALVGAGIVDWLNMHAQSNIADADMRLLKADPLEAPEAYLRNSPLAFAGRVKTPTLIIHGAADRAVPVAQAYAFYRALRERNVPVECVIYPREDHGFREREHLRDFYTRLLRWLERFVKNASQQA